MYHYTCLILNMSIKDIWNKHTKIAFVYHIYVTAPSLVNTGESWNVFAP